MKYLKHWLGYKHFRFVAKYSFIFEINIHIFWSKLKHKSSNFQNKFIKKYTLHITGQKNTSIIIKNT